MYSLYIEDEELAVLGCCSVDELCDLGRQIVDAIQ